MNVILTTIEIYPGDVSSKGINNKYKKYGKYYVLVCKFFKNLKQHLLITRLHSTKNYNCTTYDYYIFKRQTIKSTSIHNYI